MQPLKYSVIPGALESLQPLASVAVYSSHLFLVCKAYLCLEIGDAVFVVWESLDDSEETAC